jgi:type I restriction enzyme R subunit
MTPHGYTEDQLVEQPALEVLGALGWEIIPAAEETFGPRGTLGRETPGEVVLIPRLVPVPT